MSKLTLKTEGDTHIVVTRRFAAPPEAVYRAHTDPKLVQKWLLGPEGWTMPVCINDAKPGGKIPGVDRVTAWGVLAEIGLNMDQLPSLTNWASLACLCP